HERSIHGEAVEEILWFTPDGERMREEHWGEEYDTVLTIFLNGNGQFFTNPFADPVSDDSFFLIMNAHHDDINVTLPDIREKEHWCTVFDTGRGWSEVRETFKAGDSLEVLARSCWVLRYEADAGSS